VTATDTLGATGVRAYSVAVNTAMGLNPTTLPAGMVGAAYSQAMSATGGSGTYTYTVTAGSLPSGFSLNATTGVLSGTATTAVTSNFTITATDSLGGTGNRAYAVVVNAPVVVNPASLPASTQGVAYSQSVSATAATTAG